MDWSILVQRAADGVIQRNARWRSSAGVTRLSETGVHLAIVREPFLSLILSGEKTIESRFSIHDRPPFGRVAKGDLILLKAPAGQIKGLAQVRRTWYFRRNGNWGDVREQYAERMCATDAAFWDERAAKNFASLFQLDHVLRLAIPCAKRDRRAWVILNERNLWS